MTRLDALYLDHGQSPWVDNIRRDWLEDGTLSELVARGVRGVTSNPSIFAKALTATNAYDEAIRSLGSTDPEHVFETLAAKDVQDACDVLAPVYEASKRELQAGVRRHTDGFVSLEVSPRLAFETQATIDAAKRLSGLVDRPNLMIKIPATKECLEAVSAVLGLGINVNVTLIFSIERYGEVIDAFVEGVARARRAGFEVENIASVASFFVSRVDVAVDPQLPKDSELLGKVANAQVAAAYELYLERFPSGESFSGAQVQRPLWASTSTKNPAYDNLLYVNDLIANETVNTMPDPTLETFYESGSFTRSLLEDASARSATSSLLKKLPSSVSLDDVTKKLEIDGVNSFISSYEEILKTVSEKIATTK